MTSRQIFRQSTDKLTVYIRAHITTNWDRAFAVAKFFKFFVQLLENKCFKLYTSEITIKRGKIENLFITLNDRYIGILCVISRGLFCRRMDNDFR